MKIEKELDGARIIIMQDENDENELKLVVLDESIFNVKVTINGPTFRDLNNQKLEFKTAARPGRRYLYLHYLLTLFRHKRFNVEEWEWGKNKAKITNLYNLGETPGLWVRRSIIKALAFEVGDAEKLEDVIDSEVGLVDLPHAVSEEKEQRMVVSMTYNLEADTDERGEGGRGKSFGAPRGEGKTGGRWQKGRSSYQKVLASMKSVSFISKYTPTSRSKHHFSIMKVFVSLGWGITCR